MKYNNRSKAVLLLKDGTIFHGKSIGIEGVTFGEVAFNTGTTGYQEIFTDPSYFGQIMVTTNAHIGNYGVNEKEVESDSVKISGLVCKNFSFNYSREDATESLFDYLSKQNLIVISDVDTRALVSYIRDNGAMNAVICTDGTSVEELKKQLSDKHNITLNLSEPVVEYLAEQGYDKKMGARPLARKIDELIRVPLSKKILFERIKSSTINVNVGTEDEFVFDVQQKLTAEVGEDGIIKVSQ